MSRSLRAVSSIPAVPLTAQRSEDPTCGRGGEIAQSDWRWWANRAYRAWAARQEQLNLFEAPLFPEVRYSQIRELPGTEFEDLFQR